MPKEGNDTQGYWAQHYIWHSERHSQQRRTFLQKPPSENPFSWFLKNGWRMSASLTIREEKQHKTRTSWSELPADIPDPYARMPGVKEFLPITGVAEKTYFLVRMSMIFGADVHDPNSSRKTLSRKVCVHFLAPRQV